MGENLSGWAQTPQDAFDGWLESPAHTALMLQSRYTHIGIGVIEGAGGGFWWVQHFAEIAG